MILQKAFKSRLYFWDETVSENNGSNLANIMNDLNVFIVKFIGVNVKKILFVTTV